MKSDEVGTILFLHMKSNDAGTTLKHLKTVNGNVKNLCKMIENER